jgi:hypothetical protein
MPTLSGIVLDVAEGFIVLSVACDHPGAAARYPEWVADDIVVKN